MFAAMKHVDVALRIYCDTGHLDKMFACWQPKEVRNRFIIQLWTRFLSMGAKDRSCGEQRSKGGQPETPDLRAHNLWLRSRALKQFTHAAMSMKVLLEQRPVILFPSFGEMVAQAFWKT